MMRRASQRSVLIVSCLAGMYGSSCLAHAEPGAHARADDGKAEDGRAEDGRAKHGKGAAKDTRAEGAAGRASAGGARAAGGGPREDGEPGEPGKSGEPCEPCGPGGPGARGDLARVRTDAGPGQPGELETVRPVVGPPIGEVLAAVYASAGLDRQPSRSWIRRARLSGLVPRVSVRTGRNTRWQDSDPEIDYGLALEVRATWRLDRLVFESRELQVASIQASRRRERRQLARDVIRLYFGWRRASAEGDGLAAAAAAAELDALTDGWFSAELAGARRGASEHRTYRSRRAPR